MKKAYLTLENGEVIEGVAAGAERESVGELVFTTGTVGYLETLTDPSYAGQIVIQTFPMIGNYGVIPEDFEGKSALTGYVVRELCAEPSNFRSEGELDSYLKKAGIPCICGVDTRRLTKLLRDSGVMNAKISYDAPSSLEDIKAYSVGDAVKSVTTEKTGRYEAKGKKKYTVALIDYGAKGNIIKCLRERGCDVIELGADAHASEILSYYPDGVMLSNGPGDPKVNPHRIETVKALIGKVPIFGICLGHQLLALAMGGDTEKLKFGHRGANQPVKEVFGTRTYITSQNHGYAVIAKSLEGKGVQSFVNANDGSCEGIDYPGMRCFSVQFHPEANAGPMDTEFLFEKFVGMMGGDMDA
ncbi:MAG: glutamine-hydrolyzing carbamoyl-phosphate synthase small subunit [Clostridia bacterium]|nr:glutamine-hydrolyzing carbamoyl-phosphate synthase small subunit [Clostridia bacterium]